MDNGGPCLPATGSPAVHHRALRTLAAVTAFTAAAPVWEPGAATGVGSLPGEDPREAVRLVFGELPDLPHLPELPARGPGADMVGRACAVLVDLHVDLQPTGWRVVNRPGRDEHRAVDFLKRDLDALEEVGEGYTGPVKVQVAGPWTLAATVELNRGDKVLADAGAVRDLTASLTDGIRGHLDELRRRLPGASWVLQVDEPMLPAVLLGSVRTASGFGSLRAVDGPDVTTALRALFTAMGEVFPVLHCCAARPPLQLMGETGAGALSVDGATLTTRDDDDLGALFEAGKALFLGVIPSLGPGVPPSPREAADPARALWNRLGLDPENLARQVVPTPACGLAGASTGWAHTALRLVRQAGQVLLEAPEATS